MGLFTSEHHGALGCGMSDTLDDKPIDGLRSLPKLEVLDVFVVGRVQGRVRISREHPLVGELMWDSAGLYFLSPEEDERGGGMAAIRVLGLEDEQAFELVGRIVKVTGVFDASRGLEIEAIALVGQGL